MSTYFTHALEQRDAAKVKILKAKEGCAPCPDPPTNTRYVARELDARATGNGPANIPRCAVEAAAAAYKYLLRGS